MGAGELFRELKTTSEELAAVEPRSDAERDALDTATRKLTHLVELLGHRGVLKPNDVRALKQIGPQGPRVHLSTFTDKHSVTGNDVDCESLVHLCKARCCSFKIPLAEEDVLEGRLAWNLQEPYLLKREKDGYCTHLEPDGGCGCYGSRPAICRNYDCRDDRRVWLDWDAKLPAPMPSWLAHAQQVSANDPDRRTPGDEHGDDEP